MRKIFIASALALAIVTPAQAGLFGPPKFKVDQSDDRFSTDGRTTYSGLFNRISKKSIAGGTHIDDKGVFVEPIAIKNKADGKLVRLSFFIHNETDMSTNMGTPLAFGNLLKISFLTGEGAPIALPIHGSETDFGDVTAYNSVTNSASTSLRESGFANVTSEQYQRIINATALAVKIEGEKRSMVYEVKDVSKTFIPNLKGFYDEYIAK